MNRSAVLFASWTFLAGAGIPLVGILNGGMARAVGSPLSATVVMFAVALLFALGLALPLHGFEGFGRVGGASAASWAPGLLMAFYVLSATIVIPRLGTGRFVAFILIAQLITAAGIDHFGLFGLPRRPLDAIRIGGLALILTGVALMQLVEPRPPA